MAQVGGCGEGAIETPMPTTSAKQKLNCFVDETGQDDRSELFVVAVIVSISEQESLKESLIRLEIQSKVGRKKWHKLRSPDREQFLELLLNGGLAAGEVFYGKHAKPVPFFEPMVETLTNAILAMANDDHQAIVYVDGIDKKKAKSLTLALREKGIKTEQVRSARDESEPLIRLADRWAGCIRSGWEGHQFAQLVMTRALEIGYLTEV